MVLAVNLANFFIEQPKILRMKVQANSLDSPKILDRLRAEIRVRYYSICTDEGNK